MTEQCVGFNTQAEFKSLIQPESSWKTMEGEGAGLYVAGEQLIIIINHYYVIIIIITIRY